MFRILLLSTLIYLLTLVKDNILIYILLRNFKLINLLINLVVDIDSKSIFIIVL